MPDETKRYRALVDLALRKSPDPKSPLYEEWHEWPAGSEFEAPEHLKIDLGLAAGKFVEVGSAGDPLAAPVPGAVEPLPADGAAVMERTDG